MLTLPVNPEIARGVLRYLRDQAGRWNIREARSSLARSCTRFGPGRSSTAACGRAILFGTMDATPLYLCALADTVDWTGDSDLLDELWCTLRRPWSGARSMGTWTRTDISSTAAPRAEPGMEGLRRSLTNVDGTTAPLPGCACARSRATYTGACWQWPASVQSSRPRPRTCAVGSIAISGWPGRNMSPRGWMGASGSVEAITSNPGHCLWAGILAPTRARAVASRRASLSRVLQRLGDSHPLGRADQLRPGSYHNGSVWPHDCAVSAAGLRRCGLAREAGAIARSILEAGMAFPDRRMPELWCGTDRGPAMRRTSIGTAAAPRSGRRRPRSRWSATLLGIDGGRDAGPPAYRSDRDSAVEPGRGDGPPFRRATASTSRLTAPGSKVGKLPKGMKVETG